jgi:hypothetical protein
VSGRGLNWRQQAKARFQTDETLKRALAIGRQLQMRAKFPDFTWSARVEKPGVRQPQRESDSLLAQQDQRIDSYCALRRNPRSHQSQQQHRQNDTGQDQRIAGNRLIHD